MYNIAISYFAACIFYILQVYIPERRKTRRALETTALDAYNLVNQTLMFLFIWDKMVEKTSDGENNNINYINPILSIYTEDAMDGMDEYQAYLEIVRENIDMDSLMHRYPYEQKAVQEIYDLIVETVVGKGGSMTISGKQYPRELVKSRFLKLNISHVEYVMECLRKNTTKVYNIKAYLLAALFNAGATMANYYRAEVNHDMPQFAG